MITVYEGILTIIKDMWANGYRTLSCCSGHGKKIGYIIYRPPRKRLWMAVCWEPAVKIPVNLDEVVKKIDFTFLEFTMDIKLSKEHLEKFMELGVEHERKG